MYCIPSEDYECVVSSWRKNIVYFWKLEGKTKNSVVSHCDSFINWITKEIADIPMSSELALHKISQSVKYRLCLVHKGLEEWLPESFGRDSFDWTHVQWIYRWCLDPQHSRTHWIDCARQLDIHQKARNGNDMQFYSPQDITRPYIWTDWAHRSVLWTFQVKATTGASNTILPHPGVT